MTAGRRRRLISWVTRTIALLRRRVGRRGQALAVFAFIDAVIAYSLLDPTSRVQAAALPSYRAIQEVMPLAAWGWLWAGVGVACAVFAFATNDALGFTAAIGIKLVWALGFLASWLIWDAPRAWLGAATWIVVARLVVLIAGWPEPLEVDELRGPV